jgi:hypothetical protein
MMKAPALLVLAGVVLFSSCARQLGYFDKVQREARKRQFELAADLVKQNNKKYGMRDRVLYHLDRGMLYLYAGNCGSAIEYLTLAEKEMTELFTKSVTAQAASLVTSEYVLPYEGLDYEQLLINAFLALAYAGKRDIENALVEARKVQTKCDLLKQKHAKGQGTVDNGFARYISGILYESDRDWDNAYISYYTAVKAYRVEAECPVPPALKSAAFTLAKNTGREEDVKELEEMFGNAPEESGVVGKSEIVAVSFIGDGPLLISKEFATTSMDEDGKTWHLKFAVPAFVRTASAVGGVEVFLPGAAGVSSETVEDTRELCRRDLENRIGGILAKTTVRVLAKTIATQKLKKKMYTSGNPLANALIGATTNALADQLEHADTRVCRLFSGNVLLARVPVEPGEVEVTLGVRTARGSERMKTQKVDVKAGEKRFLLFADLR